MTQGRKLGLVGRIMLAVGIALGASGCLEASARGYGLGAKTLRQAQAWEVVAGLAGESERRQHELDVAREVRTEVNVAIPINYAIPVNQAIPVRQANKTDEIYLMNDTRIYGEIISYENSTVYINTGSSVLPISMDDIILIKDR